ncbi:PCNA-associated factor isoform X2 [Numenius arquata]|uniref:PCNA-associated factor isoform X2 n=1 Tax=Numenius arquata TaxID=31919 RepID=UPI003D306368
MVRTKAGGGRAGRKVLVARAPRKVLGSSSLNAGPSPAVKRGEGRRVGGNPVCPRPVPAWQKGIGDFLRLPEKENREPGGEAAGSSGLGPAPTKGPPLLPDPTEDGKSSEEEQT